jgi:hypothetical protein
MQPGDFNTSLQGPLQPLPPTTGKVRFFAEIHNRYRWLLKMGGVKVILLKRKLTGKRCVCWDPVRKSPDPVGCKECFGTGWYGGYDSPVEILASFVAPATKRIRWWDHGVWKEQEASSWMAHEPEITSRDILVNEKGERFEIVTVTPTIWRGHVLRQMFDYRLLEPSEIVYKVPVT